GGAIRMSVVILALEIMHPEQVIAPGPRDRANQLGLEPVVREIPDAVALCELFPDGPADQRVYLSLRVILLGQESELQRQPAQPRVVEQPGVLAAHLLDQVEERLKDIERALGRVIGVGKLRLAHEPRGEYAARFAAEPA